MMHCKKRGKEWWITDVPDVPEGCGPYDTKAEAEEDMRGLARSLQNADTPGYFTTDKPKSRVKRG